MIEQLKQLLKNIQIKSEPVKEKLELFFNKETITIEDLATFINLHPETAKKSKQLLGFTFYFETLHFGDNFLYLESKDNKILELKVLIKEQVIFHYRSYEGKYKISDQIKIPSIIFK